RRLGRSLQADDCQGEERARAFRGKPHPAAHRADGPRTSTGSCRMSAESTAIASSASPADHKDFVIDRTRGRVLLLTLALVVAAAAAFSYRTAGLFQAELAPELLGKSQTMADFLAADVKLAVGYGIPIDKLVGVSAYFDEKRASHPEIEFIAVAGSDGR